jgi:hypothetical protein
MRVPFFWVAKRKEPKKRRPCCLRPLRCATGQPGVLGHGVHRRTRCALARSAQTAAVSQNTKHARSDARATPCPARPRRIQKGTRGSDSHTGHCFAALRSATLSQREALAPAKAGPSKAMARVAVWLFGCLAVWLFGCLAVWLFGCLAVWLFGCPTPAGCACGGVVAGWHGRPSARASCSSSPWLFERRAQAQSEFHGAPRNRPAAGLPRSEAQGSQTGGRLFFAYFLLAKQKKVSRRRATPGSRHPTRHAAKQRARERTPVPTSSARTADKVPRPRKDPTQQQHNRYYFNSFPRLSIKAQSLKGHKTEGHPSVGIHLADEPDLQRFNLTEIGAALAAKGYFSPLRGLCTANAVTSFQLLLKSGFLFLRKILQPATRSSPLPR